jgi:adenylate cyclase
VSEPQSSGDDQAWRDFLSGTTEGLAFVRQQFARLPSPPRCKVCRAPFRAPAGPVLRLIGLRQIPGASQLCTWCLGTITKHPGGAEIELTILFSDLRGSTGIAERIGARAFRALLDRFYTLAARSVDEAHGVIDKFVGDGAIGLFFPGASGPMHAARAIDAGRAILTGAGGRDPLPVGIGVHTGIAFLGVVGGSSAPMDFTALGDAVNTASRLGSLAGAGEMLVSDASAQAAGWSEAGLEHRRLDVRGRAEAVGAWVVRG